ncbi:hypothetical protein B0J11DRAFT_264303 [Dendryphion nanum]|uniref:Uncharacterized protein n=1 Tax=Dendryphion nanum TaxID=256645 RepID=A0A9P9DZX7_9PLEO|nr:hypothetical protein B0J11DRAFT_264303 [Dendryphion nanum]
MEAPDALATPPANICPHETFYTLSCVLLIALIGYVIDTHFAFRSLHTRVLHQNNIMEQIHLQLENGFPFHAQDGANRGLDVPPPPYLESGEGEGEEERVEELQETVAQDGPDEQEEPEQLVTVDEETVDDAPAATRPEDEGAPSGPCAPYPAQAHRSRQPQSPEVSVASDPPNFTQTRPHFHRPRHTIRPAPTRPAQASTSTFTDPESQNRSTSRGESIQPVRISMTGQAQDRLRDYIQQYSSIRGGRQNRVRIPIDTTRRRLVRYVGDGNEEHGAEDDR